MTRCTHPRTSRTDDHRTRTKQMRSCERFRISANARTTRMNARRTSDWTTGMDRKRRTINRTARMEWRIPLGPNSSLLVERREGGADGHWSRRKRECTEEGSRNVHWSRRTGRCEREHLTDDDDVEDLIHGANITSTDRWRRNTRNIGYRWVRHRLCWRAGGCCFLRACGVTRARCHRSRSSSDAHSVS